MRKERVYIDSADFVELVRGKPGITYRELQDATELSDTGVFNKVDKLVNEGILIRKRTGRSIGIYIKSGQLKLVKEQSTEASAETLIVHNPPISVVIPREEITVEKVKTEVDKVIGSQPMESLLATISTRISDTIVSQVIANLFNTLPSIIPAVTLPSNDEVLARLNKKEEAPREQKLKVLVLGLLSQQAGRLQAELHDCLDLAFWNDRNGDGKDKLKSLTKWSDRVFVHTQHMGHSAQEIVKANGGIVVTVPGGLTQMQEALTAYYIEDK